MHWKDMVLENEMQNFVTCFVDADVLVLETVYIFTLTDQHLETIWIASGTGKKFRIIHVHKQLQQFEAKNQLFY